MQPPAMPVITTLGPAGSNHEWVTRRYLDFHGIADARIDLVLDFDDAVQRVLDGRADHIVQCAAHAAVARTVGAHRDRLFLIDTFLAPSRELAVLVRRDVTTPRSLGLQPATRSYLDTSRWVELIDEVSIVTVAEGLLASRYDAGVTAADYAVQYPDRLHVDERLGTVVDAWLVYGRQPVCSGAILAWGDSPGAQLVRGR
jgi:hypothetical protein